MEQWKEEKKSLLAKEILEMGKTKILLHMPFFRQALHELQEIEYQESGIKTDGEHLYYDPRSVLVHYRTEENSSVRMWIHPLMHCLFLHMFVDSSVTREVWNLSCDMAAEKLMDDLGFYRGSDPMDQMRRSVLNKIGKQVKPMTGEKIYRFLMEETIDPGKWKEWQRLFLFDDHSLWYERKKEKNQSEGGTRKNAKEKKMESRAAEDGSGKAKQEARKRWEKISKKMESELKVGSRQHGERTKDLEQMLSILHRKKCDYSAFLRKFAVRSEAMKTSPEEFDYIFYTYGMELYQDMPLIEPLEYCEDKKIRDFVIVIDTSGSVQGEMIRLFLETTYLILKQQEAFDRQFRIHIIQCDAQVKRDDVLTCRQDLEFYLEHVEIRGLGGTDFRPAFEYVEMLRKNRAFHKLKGLLYFTDGIGKYPQKCPDYMTAFVFVDQEASDYAQVPPWALQVLVEQEDLSRVRVIANAKTQNIR